VTPGGGGFGPPEERDPAALTEDAVSGKFSGDFLKAGYPAFGGFKGSCGNGNAQVEEHMDA
jgi:N-methylhydantoinase B/oxoprolinase/acetone carboxylase alpha subunit